MQLKTMWMRYLLIGINFLATVLVSCNKTEPPIRKAKYVYINDLKGSVFLETYFKNRYISYLINGKDSLVYFSEGEGVFPFYSEKITYLLQMTNVDSVVIRFNERCAIYRYIGTHPSSQIQSGGVFNLMEYDNYSSDLVNQKDYTLRYSIDSTDYIKAVPCK